MITHVYAMGVGAVLSALITWQLSSWHYLSQLQTERLALQQSHSEALAKAAETTRQLQKAKDEALEKSSHRQRKLAADLDRSDTALGLLHDAANSAVRNAAHSHTTCQQNAERLNDVFRSCTGQLVDLGAAADGWRDEALTLRDAWPSVNQQ